MRIIGIGEVLKDFGKLLRTIVTNVVTFIKDRTQGIARWIASQGGWVCGAVLQHVSFERKLPS